MLRIKDRLSTLEIHKIDLFRNIKETRKIRAFVRIMTVY